MDLYLPQLLEGHGDFDPIGSLGSVESDIGASHDGRWTADSNVVTRKYDQSGL